MFNRRNFNDEMRVVKRKAIFDFDIWIYVMFAVIGGCIFCIKSCVDGSAARAAGAFVKEFNEAKNE